MKFQVYSWEITYSVMERKKVDKNLLPFERPYYEWVQMDSGKEILRAPTAADVLTMWNANHTRRPDKDGHVRRMEHICLVEDH